MLQRGLSTATFIARGRLYIAHLDPERKQPNILTSMTPTVAFDLSKFLSRMPQDGSEGREQYMSPPELLGGWAG